MHDKEITVYLLEKSLTSGIMQILMKKNSQIINSFGGSETR